MWVGNGVVMGVGLGVEGEGEDAKTRFSAGNVAHITYLLTYIHYFKDIHQGALQSDCVMQLINS